MQSVCCYYHQHMSWYTCSPYTGLVVASPAHTCCSPCPRQCQLIAHESLLASGPGPAMHWALPNSACHTGMKVTPRVKTKCTTTHTKRKLTGHKPYAKLPNEITTVAHTLQERPLTASTAVSLCASVRPVGACRKGPLQERAPAGNARVTAMATVQRAQQKGSQCRHAL
jgi:hypothetical protein